MTNLSSFAELMKKATEEKNIRLIAEQKKREEEITPLLSELFSSVITGKKANQSSVLKEGPLLAELKAVITNPKAVENISTDVVNLIEEIEIKAANIQNSSKELTSKSEKRFLKLFNQLQADFQTLKKYVEGKSQTSGGYGGSGGSGEVRILRMDDMEKGVNPSNGDTLVWSSALNKFVLKQPIASDGSSGSIISDEEMPYAKRVDFVSDNELYKGEAVVGSLVTTSVWRIRKIVISNDGDVSEIWADGNSNYDNSWANRLTYSYS